VPAVVTLWLEHIPIYVHRGCSRGGLRVNLGGFLLSAVAISMAATFVVTVLASGLVLVPYSSTLWSAFGGARARTSALKL